MGCVWSVDLILFSVDASYPSSSLSFTAGFWEKSRRVLVLSGAWSLHFSIIFRALVI